MSIRTHSLIKMPKCGKNKCVKPNYTCNNQKKFQVDNNATYLV